MDLDLPMKIPYFFRTGILIALISIPLVLSNPSLHQWFTGQTSLSTKYFQTQNQALDKTEEQDYKGAILAYSKALKIGEEIDFIDAHTYVNCGLAYYKLEDAKRAILDLNQALKIEPHRAHTYNDRGRSQQLLGNTHEALEDYNQALKLDPKFSEAYSNRGVIYAQLGEIDLAFADQNRALKLNPYFASAYYNRGNLNLAQARYQKLSKITLRH